MARVENYKFEALDENYNVDTYNTCNICSNTLILTRKPEIDIYWLYCLLPGYGFVWVTHWRVYTCKEFAECMREYRQEYGRYPEMIWGHKIREGK
nr:MAG TPA: hypothetical protein [Caudoviricetes sp.]